MGIGLCGIIVEAAVGCTAELVVDGLVFLRVNRCKKEHVEPRVLSILDGYKCLYL